MPFPDVISQSRSWWVLGVYVPTSWLQVWEHEKWSRVFLVTSDGVFPREERLKYTEKAADQREHSARISYLSAFQLKPFNLILSWDTCYPLCSSPDIGCCRGKGSFSHQRLVVGHKSGCSSLSKERSLNSSFRKVCLCGVTSVEGPGSGTGVCDGSEALSERECLGRRPSLSGLENAFRSFPWRPFSVESWSKNQQLVSTAASS